MESRRTAVFLLLIALTLSHCGPPSGGGCSASSWLPRTDQFLGTPAPDFVLPDLEGKEVSLTGIVGQKPVLLVFWATWCPSCIEEIPVLNAWSEKYPHLQILAVNVQESADRIRSFAKKREIHYPILLDPEGDVAHRYGLVGIPAAILIAKGGRVIYYGFSLPSNIEQLIKV